MRRETVILSSFIVLVSLIFVPQTHDNLLFLFAWLTLLLDIVSSWWFPLINHNEHHAGMDSIKATSTHL